MFEWFRQHWTVFKFFIPIVIGVLFSTFVFGIPDLYILTKRGVPVGGVVTGFDQAENDTAYTYSFASAEYHDRFLYHKGSNPGYPQVGDQLNLTVDPENPRRHRMGNVNVELRDSLIGTLFIVVALSVGQLLRLLPNPFKRSDQEAKEEWEKHRRDPWFK